MFCSISWLKLLLMPECTASTTGDSPVTTIDCSTLPTFSCDVELNGAADLDADRLAPDVPKPCSVKVSDVLAERQVLEAVESLAVGDFDGGAADPRRAGGFDGDAGEHAAGIVLDEPAQAAGGRLRRSGRDRERGDDCQREEQRDRSETVRQ